MTKEEILQLYDKTDLPVEPDHGQGKSLASSWVYIGSFKDGIYSGEGELYRFDGRHQKGTFRNGFLSGRGTETSSDGLATEAASSKVKNTATALCVMQTKAYT